MITINTNSLEYMKTIPDNSVDLILTDPPYGTTYLDFDKNIPDPDIYMKEFQRILKPSGTAVIFCASRFMFRLYAAAPKWYRYDIIFEKKRAVGFLSSKVRQLRAHENIFIFGATKGVYNPQMRKGKPYKIKRAANRCALYGNHKESENVNTGVRYPRSVINDMLSDTSKSHHPTEKPVSIMKELVLTYSNEGDTVFDPFMGAGSSGVACAMTNRKYIGVELDKVYFDIAFERISTKD